MSEPEWSDFKVVLALGRGGSVAAAARILGVDGSTISRRLAAAEAAMGAVLIVRGGREFAFTTAGRTALAAGEAMDAAVTAASASVRATRADLTGMVHITMTPSLFHFLAPFPTLVADKHPGLLVEINSTRAVVDLAKGDADIALRVNRPTDLDLIVGYTFGMGMALYAAKGYLDSHGRPTSAEDLHRHKLVLYSTKFSAQPYTAWLNRFADPAKPYMSVDSVDTAHTMIAAGHGIGVLWCCHADAFCDMERVLPDPIHTTSVYTIWHASLRGSARLKAVVDMLTAHLIKNRATLQGKA